MVLNEKRVLQHIRSFERAIQEYSEHEPLARFLTKYFKNNRQMGSSDRRMTSRLCYNYFRIGKLWEDASQLDRLVLAEFLCEEESALVALYQPTWIDIIPQDINTKLKYIGIDLDEIFPFVDKLSEDIDQEKFLVSQCTQPDLFIRVRRGHESQVKAQLSSQSIEFVEKGKQALALANGTKLQELHKIEGLYEVQDWSSQQTVDYMVGNEGEYWWDACAASGGKSLLFLDKYPKVNLLVSDIRLSILRNLDERFDRAGINRPYRKKVIDITGDVKMILGKEQFDGIILDVPCSGSGTWGRTPEMKNQFSLQKLSEFTDLQRRIVSNAVAFLKSGSALTYITCSVYREENEGIVDYMVNSLGMTLDKKQILNGYQDRADTMFVARLIRL